MRFSLLVLIILAINLVYGISSQEKVDIQVDDNLLSVTISNLNANCCSGFVPDYHMNFASGLITITLTDTTIQKCKCNCKYDININIGPISQGKYTVLVIREDLARYSYPKDKRIQLERKDISVYDPHPKSPISMDFRQSACKSLIQNISSEVPLKGGVEIFANPSSNSVALQFHIKENSDATIKIMNFLGKVINESKHPNLKSGNIMVNLDMKEIPPGMYLGKIQTSRGQFLNFKLMWSK